MKNKKIINPVYPYNYNRLCLSIRRLAKCYSDVIHLHGGGLSAQSRCIPLISLGNGKKKTLSVGAIHGREYVTVGYLLLCLEEYAEAFCKNELYYGTDVRDVLSEYTIHFVPVANPDSVEIALGRAKPSVQVPSFSSFFTRIMQIT